MKTYKFKTCADLCAFSEKLPEQGFHLVRCKGLTAVYRNDFLDLNIFLKVQNQ